MKTAIITGASSGFGLLSAIELAKRGFHVIACLRNIEKAEHLLEIAKSQSVDSKIEIFKLDVTDSFSIERLDERITKCPTIDVLVNNAGYAQGGFCEELEMNDYLKQFETNVFGLISVTKAVIPHMRRNMFGRIINVSSISGKIGFPGLSAYAASKFAVEGFSESLRLELKPFGIDVVLVEPGSYRTNIWSSIDSGVVNDESPYFSYMNGILMEINNGKAQHGDPQDVAKLIGDIATQKKSPKLRYPIGKGVKASLILKTLIPWRIIEKIITKKLSP